MTLIRAAAVIDAGEPAVVRALATGATWRRTARALGGRVSGPTGQLQSGDTLTFTGSIPWWPGRNFTVELAETGLPQLSSTGRSAVTISLHTSPTEAGTLTRLDYRTSGSALATAIQRTRVLRAGEMLLGIAILIAREPMVVVAGVLLDTDDQGRPTVLAARKTDRSSDAGKWELPGGKVEPGESEQIALARELAEELNIGVRVDRRVGPEVDLGDGAVLRAWTAAVVDGAPTLSVHEELRWVTADRATSMDWLPADLEMLSTPDLWSTPHCE